MEDPLTKFIPRALRKYSYSGLARRNIGMVDPHLFDVKHR